MPEQEHSAPLHETSLSSGLAAAERALMIEEGLQAVQAWEADHGKLTDEELAYADRVLDELVNKQDQEAQALSASRDSL